MLFKFRYFQSFVFPIFLIFFYFFSLRHCCAQIHQPVKWSFSSCKSGERELDILLKAKIDKGWHIYSQKLPDGDGPIPSSFKFKENSAYQLVGKVTEPKAITKYDPAFDMQLSYFEGEVTFRQKVKLTQSGAVVKGELEYMVCNEQMCLPPEIVEFEMPVNDAVQPCINYKNTETALVGNSTDQQISVTDSIVPLQPDSANNNSYVTMSSSSDELEPGCGDTVSEAGDMSLMGIFIAGLLGGLLALLTPCVFPMIPLTVSFFTKGGVARRRGVFNAMVYALSIVVIYVGLGFIITKLFGSDALNAMASDAYFNLAFFVIFLTFAISFFGAFEITLPNSWINKADKASDQGGFIGIFFMAFTLSLVSFSCTGPIIGTLLVQAAVGGSNIGPIVGMTGFAVALAGPFALFAAFPRWLSSLPKSGGWLNTVKVSLGFLELALALKFLSNVDLAYHWGILQRELFIAVWVIVFAMWGLYLLGVFHLEHDSPKGHISIHRMLMSLIVLGFTVYLIPGLWGAPLKLISGFPPPVFYKEWFASSSSSHCPHNLNCVHDYDEGMNLAKTAKKPVIIDFTGWSCVNCRKMEDNVWSEPAVLRRLSNDFVLISLYVDDKETLPEGQQYQSEFSGKKIRTVGNKWSDFQASVYKTNSQPYYVLLDNQGKLLANPRGYTPDAHDYLKYLEEGICRYNLRERQ